MSVYFLLFSKPWSVGNESIPEALLCILDLFINRVWTHAFSAFSVFKKRHNLSLEIGGLCTKLAVLDFRSWCRPDFPDTQIRNSCSMTWLPSSLQTLLHIWDMPGSWGTVHVQVLPPPAKQLWVSAMTCLQTWELTVILQCRDSQWAAAWSLRVVSWFSSSNTQSKDVSSSG